MDLTSVSRFVSRALRHEPWRYELELDGAGWVSVDEMLGVLRAENSDWASLSESDLARMIERSEKKRHELRGGKIRALYGHSTPHKLLKDRSPPPAVLFHGTAPDTATKILSEGLRPMGRQYVHLSADMKTADQVGKRKSRTPVILQVRADDAHKAGVAFYRGNDMVWLADFIEPEFIR